MGEDVEGGSGFCAMREDSGNSDSERELQAHHAWGRPMLKYIIADKVSPMTITRLRTRESRI